MFNVSFDHQIKPTDLLTSVSVLCAVLALIYTWRKDRWLRSREYADKIRSAAAITLSKVDRGEMLLNSFIELIQPAISEADILFVEKRNVVDCRDQLWKKLYEIRSSMMSNYQVEGIEIAYAPLLVYRKNIYGLFQVAMRTARAVEQASFLMLQDQLQREILTTDPAQIHSAELGNSLRSICSQHSRLSEVHLSNALDEVRVFLRQTINMSDREMLKSPEDHEVQSSQREERCNPSFWLDHWQVYKTSQSGEATRQNNAAQTPHIHSGAPLHPLMGRERARGR